MPATVHALRPARGTCLFPVINGTDKAQTIAGSATKLEAILRASIVAATGGVPLIPQPQPAASGTRFTVTAQTLNVRSGPGTSSAPVGTVSRGTVVTAIVQQHGWKQITAPAIGWVSGKFLEVAVPVPA